MAMVMIVAIVAIVVAIAFDYADHLNHSGELKRLIEETRERSDMELRTICDSYREFQQTPDGKGVTIMDDICQDVEERFKKT